MSAPSYRTASTALRIKGTVWRRGRLERKYDWEIREDELNYGAEEPLIRDPIRSLRVDTQRVQLHQSYSLLDGKAYPRTALQGDGVLEKATIAIAGEEDSGTRTLSVSLVRMSPEMVETDAEFQWRISIGFLPADWEIGSDDSWWAQAYIPTDVFDALLTAHREGRVGKVWFHASTDLWIRKAYVRAPPSTRVEWYLDPGRHRIPGLGKGSSEGFGWDEARPAPLDIPGVPGPENSSRDTELAAPVQQLTRVLKYGFAAVVVILALLALR